MTRENTCKGRAPYMRVWVADYLNDSAVDEMDNTERGIYTTLLFMAWNLANKNEMPPTLQYNLHYLAGVCRSSEQALADFFAKYPSLWRVTSDGKRIYQKRELAEYIAMLEEGIARSEASEKANATQGKSTAKYADIRAAALILLEKCKAVQSDTVTVTATDTVEDTPTDTHKIDRDGNQYTDIQINRYTDIKNKELEVLKGVTGGKTETPPPTPNNGEQLTLKGIPATRLFSYSDFTKLWDEWKKAYSLEMVDCSDAEATTDAIKAQRRRKFQARQKAFAKYGANEREFWADLLTVAAEYNNGFYTGNSTPKEGYSQPFVISIKWLLESDGNIAKLLNAKGSGGIEVITAGVEA